MELACSEGIENETKKEEFIETAQVLLTTTQSYAMVFLNLKTISFVTHPRSPRQARISPGGLSYDTTTSRFEIWANTDKRPDKEGGDVYRPSRWYSAIASNGFKLLTGIEMGECNMATKRFVPFELVLQDMNWDSECRFGFALKNASPILGEDGLSWACDLMTGNYVHEGILAPYISDEWSLCKVEQSGPLVSKLSTSDSISLVLDLLSGDILIYVGSRRVGPVMVNLRRCLEQRRLALKQVGFDTEEDELIFPAFCAKNATALTRLHSNDYRSKNETRNFRNFPSLYASYKKSLACELIFPQPCDSLVSMNKDCLQNICQYLPYSAKFDLRNTCRVALELFYEMEWRRTITITNLVAISDLNDLYADQGLKINVELTPPLQMELKLDYSTIQPFFIAVCQPMTNRSRHFQVGQQHPKTRTLARLNACNSSLTKTQCEFTLATAEDFEFWSAEVVVFVIYVSSLGFYHVSKGVGISIPEEAEFEEDFW